jgi:Lon protease-like protein
MNSPNPDLLDFDGVARLFPLPNVVLFPNLLQGLHIFEPRYRQMTADALDGDRLIAMVLPRPGWETCYEGRPPLHAVGCLGKIITDQRLPDGRFNLQLRGLVRVRIAEELETGRLYRSARVEVLAEVDEPTSGVESELRKEITGAIPTWSARRPYTQEMFGRLLGSALPLATVVDVLAFALPLPVEVKQQLLEDRAITQRARRLTVYLATHLPEPADASSDVPPNFPPNFSAN